MRSLRITLIVLSLVTCHLSPAFAAAKVFSGAGDGTSWHDDQNWSAAGTPGQADGVTITLSDAAVVVKENFLAQSVTVAGKATSTWTVDPSVYGTIAPSSTSDSAIFIRKDGTVVFKGTGGIVTLKGAFKNSEETLSTEPSATIFLR